MRIDKKWLRSLGFKQHPQEAAGWFYIHVGRKVEDRRLVIRVRSIAPCLVEFHDGTISEDGVQIVRLPYVTLRSEVKLLCRALKITTKKG